MPRSPLTIPALACATLAGAALLLAGPLDPPSGPVGSTYKTLSEVEPRIAISAANTPGDADSVFKITEPGSYYLTGGMTGAAGKHGIEIISSSVTLDLNGFTMQGVAGSLDGVSTTVSGLDNIEVRNGSIVGWGESGIDFGYRLTRNSVISDIRSGENAQIGISAGVGNTIAHCIAYGNLSTGIGALGGSNITDSAANDNVGWGIRAGSGCVVTSCSALLNGQGGILANDGSVVTQSTANSNAGSGIFAADGCTVGRCSVRDNTVDGIVVGSQSIILENTCTNNGSGSTGAGIHATDLDNRIEGNNCSLNVRGFDIDRGGNFIVRNTCSGSTTVNWDIAAGNTILIVNAATIGGAIFGNSGGTPPGSTDPNANFTY
ncbi:MAG: right-handed parallel beta-helix repeat-containing protein [Phycisphaerales bacterium]|nr:right-handed parallel beta-helix repeat-containing protein [Phycisphaerales bacterium]